MCKSVCFSLSIHPSSVRLFVCLSICLSVYLLPSMTFICNYVCCSDRLFLPSPPSLSFPMHKFSLSLFSFWFICLCVIVLCFLLCRNVDNCDPLTFWAQLSFLWNTSRFVKEELLWKEEIICENCDSCFGVEQYVLATMCIFQEKLLNCSIWSVSVCLFVPKSCPQSVHWSLLKSCLLSLCFLVLFERNFLSLFVCLFERAVLCMSVLIFQRAVLQRIHRFRQVAKEQDSWWLP